MQNSYRLCSYLPSLCFPLSLTLFACILLHMYVICTAFVRYYISAEEAKGDIHLTRDRYYRNHSAFERNDYRGNDTQTPDFLSRGAKCLKYLVCLCNRYMTRLCHYLRNVVITAASSRSYARVSKCTRRVSTSVLCPPSLSPHTHTHTYTHTCTPACTQDVRAEVTTNGLLRLLRYLISGFAPVHND